MNQIAMVFVSFFATMIAFTSVNAFTIGPMNRTETNLTAPTSTLQPTNQSVSVIQSTTNQAEDEEPNTELDQTAQSNLNQMNSTVTDEHIIFELNSTINRNKNFTCKQETDFDCQTVDTTTCIPIQWKCDGVADCPNGQDELNCEAAIIPEGPKCRDYQFECQLGNDSMCIYEYYRCDGDVDCPNQVDELNCTSPQSCSRYPARTFHCRSSQTCIRAEKICDGVSDCDGLDEGEYFCGIDKTNCIPDIEFNCQSWEGNELHCIPIESICDGIPQCDNALDEQNCQAAIIPEGPKCRDYQFECQLGNDSMCIHEYYRCDGDVDCPNQVDELNCTSPQSCSRYPARTFHCRSSQTCIRAEKICDGVSDCDGLDEGEYFCGIDKTNCIPDIEFNCQSWEGNELQCIPIESICDGIPQCDNALDEQNCQKNTCADWKVLCPVSKKCIMKAWMCDGEADCTHKNKNTGNITIVDEWDEDPANCAFTNTTPRPGTAQPEVTTAKHETSPHKSSPQVQRTSTITEHSVIVTTVSSTENHHP